MIHCIIKIILSSSCACMLYLVLSHHSLRKYVGIYICMYVYSDIMYAVAKVFISTQGYVFKKVILWSNLNAVREKGLNACTFI